MQCDKGGKADLWFFSVEGAKGGIDRRESNHEGGTRLLLFV